MLLKIGLYGDVDRNNVSLALYLLCSIKFVTFPSSFP